MALSNAVVLTLHSVASLVIELASSRAASISAMKAARPNFTSITSASIPSASFLERILAVMSGIDGTVPVTSRSA